LTGGSQVPVSRASQRGRTVQLSDSSDSSADEDVESETDGSSASDSSDDGEDHRRSVHGPATRGRESDSDSDDSGGSDSGSADSGSADEMDEADDDDSLEESTVEVRVHVHEAKELTPMDGSTSDPYAYVTCFGQSERTKTASKGTDAIWDEELQFSGTKQELEGAMVNVAVWDEDLAADDLIGSFSFDLEDVRNRPDKEVCDCVRI
jgi:hypothetical protein